MLLLGLCSLHFLLYQLALQRRLEGEREDLLLALPVKVTLAVGFSLPLPLHQAHEPSQRHSISQLFLALRRASRLLVSVSPTSWLPSYPALFTK